MASSALRTLLVLAAAAASRAGPPYGHPRPGATYPDHPGMTLWLVEEFDAPLSLDADPIWTWSDGGLFEGQVRFSKSAIQFRDGKLIIEASRGDPNEEPCSHAEKAIVKPKTLTSGELRTRHNMFRYGLYEVRMKAPSVRQHDSETNGNYISTMFAYRDAKFRHWREIDIEVTGDGANTVTMNVLNAENTILWSERIQSSQQVSVGNVNVREDFHTYAFDWRPDGITWFFDGKPIAHHGPGDKLGVPDKSAKILMNLWIFNTLYDFGGREGANNQYPMRTEYDWFRFYKWNGDKQYPCVGMGTSCLTEDDRYLSSNNPCDGIAQVGLVNGTAPCRAACGRVFMQAANETGGLAGPLFP